MPSRPHRARARRTGGRAARGGCAAGSAATRCPDPGQHHVAVVDLAEDALQPPGGVAGRLRLRPEAGPGDLEHVAQPLGGDPHVVLGRAADGSSAAGAKREQLVQPGADDPRRVGTQRRRRVEALHLACLQSPPPSPALPRRCRSFFRRLGATKGANSSFACRCSRRSRSTSPATAAAGRPRGLTREPLEELDRHIAVAPLAERVGQRLDPLQRLALPLRAESRARRPPARRAGGASPPACHAHARSRRCRARRRSGRRPRRRAPRPHALRHPRTAPHNRIQERLGHAPRIS